MPESPSRRTADVAGHRVRVDVEPVLLDDLDDGDWFLGPDAALYKVTTPAATHPRGWTDVVNLSIADAEADTRATAGDVDGDGAAGPRDGFFAYGVPVTVDRVLAVLDTLDEPTPRRGADPAAGVGPPVMAILLGRWAGTDRGPLRYDAAPAYPAPPDGLPA